uniref:C-X-C motif chemokine 2 n=2 Tax=Macrostomum lignano TaxID=282301 RepID=A0A1I8JKZ5_9PLAT
MPRWTITDAMIFLLVLTGWAAAIALFLHKLGNLQISRSTCDSVRHLKPKNIDKVKVCKEPSDTVIYREYARGSRMSVCLEERQARIAHLQRLYAEELERELEAIEEQGGSAELCGLRPMRPKPPKPFHRHHTLEAISPQRLPTYAVVAEGGINLQQLPQLPQPPIKTPLGQTFSASAVDGVPRSQGGSTINVGPTARRVVAVKTLQQQARRTAVQVSADGTTQPLLTRQLSESAFSRSVASSTLPARMASDCRSGSDAVISYV